jgi:hypothetical protein
LCTHTKYSSYLTIYKLPYITTVYKGNTEEQNNGYVVFLSTDQQVTRIVLEASHISAAGSWIVLKDDVNGFPSNSDINFMALFES